jgi:thioredoxin reductase
VALHRRRLKTLSDSFRSVDPETVGFRQTVRLALQLGARTDEDGYVVTDERSEVLDPDGAPITGLFAVGDLRAGRYKQIVVGWGDAETAIVTAHAHRMPA